MKIQFGKLNIFGSYAASNTDMMMFGFIGSPVVFFSISFIGGTIVCSFIIILTTKMLKTIGILGH